MKTFLQKITLLIAVFGASLFVNKLYAQCSPASINWDYQYYKNSVLPSSGINYMLGKNTLTMEWAGDAGFNGVVDEQTGETNTFGDGNDAKFTVKTGSVTFTFLEEVTDLEFTVSDVDYRQIVSPTAKNASNAALNITVAKAGSNGTVNGSGGKVPYYYNNNNVATNSNNASANISVAGPVKSIKLAFTNSRSSNSSNPIYISDISACVNGVWSTDYQSISAPETGQPTYMLVSYDSIVYVVDKLNNVATQLYADPSMNRLNAMAYDPYKQVIYYCDSRRDVSNKSVYKYDVKTGVKSTFIEDVNDLGIQTFVFGLATSGSSFYDGYLFLGTDQDQLENTPVAIYRIDINPTTGAAIRASRFWGANSKIGSTSLYDWGDFVVNSGILYNFNAATGAASGTKIEHFDLNKQTKKAGYSPAITIAQASLDYEGNIFSVETGKYRSYNKATGGLSSLIYYTGVDTTKRLITDGAESFKYPFDYGDAPLSYGVASHIFRVSPNLMIGTKVDYEMKSYNSLNAAADDDDDTNGAGNDEDGVDPAYFVTNPIRVSYASYSVPVTVKNTTGSNAYLYAYLDYNLNGNFSDPGERSNLVTIPNNANPTTVNVNWTALSGGKVGASFVRFRIASNSTDISSGSGYARSGEVEDYQINIEATALPVELINLSSVAQENNTTLLTWSTASEFNNDYFDVEHYSQDGNWESIGKVKGFGNSNSLNNYSLIDKTPHNGINYYRLKQVDFNSSFEYSYTVSATFNINANNQETAKPEISIYPNPTKDDIWVKSNQSVNNTNDLNIDVYNPKGERVASKKLNEDIQKVDFSYYENGMYFIQIGSQSFKVIKQ